MNEEQWRSAQIIASNIATQEALTLVKYGFPFDLAFQLPDEYRFAFVVFYKTSYEDFEFDWNTRMWSLKVHSK